MNRKDPKLLVQPSPLLKQRMTTDKAMRDALYALLPAILAAVWLFGLGSFLVLAAAVLGAVLTEWAFSPPVARRSRLQDGSGALTGLLLGQTLHTRPEEIYRALVEATAFGALTIINRFEEYGVKINEVVNCGGIAEKNAMLMQIYADVTGREMKLSRSAQTCALGSAIAGAVVGGAYKDFASAQAAMCGIKETTFKPIQTNHKVYQELYKLYKQLHDGFGLKDQARPMANVMKDLLRIKEGANA